MTGYTVDKELLNRYKKHMADEQKRLFPPFAANPPFQAMPWKKTVKLSSEGADSLCEQEKICSLRQRI